MSIFNRETSEVKQAKDYCRQHQISKRTTQLVVTCVAHGMELVPALQQCGVRTLSVEEQAEYYARIRRENNERIWDERHA